MTRPRRLRALAAVATATAFALLPAVPAHADAIRDQQWGLEALHTDTAWQTTKGKGITVAVLDTGVDDDHPDLAGQVLPGKDLIGFGAEAGDHSWALHGTAMAGIIAGRGNGPGRADGVLGVAPEAKILPVRVILESGDPSRAKARESRGTALADGIRWAADQGADVINLSLGDDSESAHPEPGEDAAVQYALGKGVSVVASAGNSGEKGDRISYPAAYPGVIAVAAVDKYGTHAAFSTRRWYATVSAPGVDIVVANPDRQYYIEWGTSAASAFVSGAVALVRAAHPGLSPDQVKTLLADTAGNAPSGGRDDARGYGLVDPAAAIEAGAKLSPGGLRAESAKAGYRKEYFGSGPAPQADDGEPAGWLAPTAGGLGAALLALAVVLWRGRRPGGRGPGGAPPGHGPFPARPLR
ncbi:type VII secretion-associated serine protease mycosin [Streptomyces sp. NPDC048565]|uniref:type VII secretion-associated serine protease mycosin n=1 Tax=Streptomyces sp. NPDC048565 TaxID=3155266 RepID=UPI003429CDFA